jgi:hypothetical protein
MNTKAKLEEVVQEHNNIARKIEELTEAKFQLLGQAKLLQEILAEEENPESEPSPEPNE